MVTGLGAGWPAGGSSAGSAEITIAPFSFPLYCARSSTDCAFTYTTGPRTGPFVDGAQAYDAIASGCNAGLMMLPFASPRVRDGPRFQMGIRDAVIGEFLSRPVAGLLQIFRTGEPRADHV